MNRHGMVMDVFGEWVDPAEAVPAAPPVRTYVVDDAMRAADASARAAAAAVVSDWPLKGLLGRVEARPAVGFQLPHRALVAPLSARDVRAELLEELAEVDAAVTELEVAVQMEDVDMTKLRVDEDGPATVAGAVADLAGTRLCAVAECGKLLAAHNTSGRCGRHYYLKAGTVLRDGAVSPKNQLPVAPAEAALREIVQSAAPAAPASPGAVVQAAIASPPPNLDGGGRVSLSLSVAALDAFLLRLAVEDKARIVAAVLER